MNLAARRSARQREDFVMRVGCLLVTAAVLSSLVLEPPRAKAFAATSAAISALAGGFLNACGLAPVVSGMNSSEEVNESVARLIQDYLDTMGAATPEEWLGQELGLTLSGGKIYLPKPIAAKLGQFATWVASKYATKPGMNQVYGATGAHLLLADGSQFLLSTLDVNGEVVSPGTIISTANTPMVFSTGAKITFGPWEVRPNEWVFRLVQPDGSIHGSGAGFLESHLFCLGICLDGSLRYFWKSSVTGSWEHVSTRYSLSTWLQGDVLVGDESLSLDVSDTMQEVLDRLTALEEGQSIVLDVGATQSMELQEILQGILDAILAGDLTASAEIVDTAEVPVEPELPVVPEVPEDLDKLGAALTSRFPFSIPWDVYKGVTLLAAPPKAPYFEVDFMAPIADRVGGWQGSTKIVLDMSEYEIIGQVCRWSSTIGFCLMLAAGTKRLIWTA